MKRYSFLEMTLEDSTNEERLTEDLMMIETPDGEWVKWEDIEQYLKDKITLNDIRFYSKKWKTNTRKHVRNF